MFSVVLEPHHIFIAYQKKLEQCVVSYAIALFLMGITTLLNSSLSAQFLTNFASGLALIYFSACMWHTKALYARLHIAFSWQRCVTWMLLGIIGVYFFSQVHVEESLRILMVSLTTLFICFISSCCLAGSGAELLSSSGSSSSGA